MSNLVETQKFCQNHPNHLILNHILNFGLEAFLSSFPRKFEKLSKSRLIWGCCNRPGDFGHEHLANYLKFVLQKNMFISHVLSAITCFSQDKFENLFDRGKFVWWGLGSPKWTFFQRSFRKNLNCEQSMNDKQIIVCVLQISANSQSNRDQFHLAE